MSDTASPSPKPIHSWRIVALCFAAALVGGILGGIISWGLSSYLSGLIGGQGSAGQVIAGNSQAIEAINHALDILRRAGGH